MNDVGKFESYRGYEGLLLPVLFVGKQSEGHGYEIEEIWNQKQL